MDIIRELNDKIAVTKPYKVYEQYLQEFGNEDREFFIVIGLDTKMKAIYREVVSIGTLNNGLVHPREVFKKAIIMSSHSIILAHNHPSQDLEPSNEDLEVTRNIKKAGELLDIKLLDHLIFNKENYKSIIKKV